MATRVADSVWQHANATHPLTACGLLIGRTTERGLWVERTLRCVNLVPSEAKVGTFEIDPRVMVNVTRSLGSSPNRIVGFYRSGGEPLAQPAAGDLALLEAWPDAVLVIQGERMLDGGGLRAWGRSGGKQVMELEIAVVEPPRARLLVCPE